MRLPEVIQSPALFALPGVRHGFFTRRGGVSAGVYGSLNVGLGSRDEPSAVAENRRRAANAFDLAPERLATAYQVHSAVAHVAALPWGDARPQGDAVVTDQTGMLCGVLSADCAPVLLADAEGQVVAAAHAGWRGALSGVVESTVAVMEGLGARRARMVAVVGPCIGPDSYEVGSEFLDRFTAEVPGAERFFTAEHAPGRRRFDLPGFVLHRLERAGVQGATWLGRDTYAEPGLFFSHRRAVHRGEDDYGRLLSAIMLS